MKKYGKKDDNHNDIAKAFEQCGCSVQDLSMVGDGCPDMIIGFMGHTIPIEVKNGELPKSKTKLTTDQEKWHSKWRGTVVTVFCVMGAIELINTLRKNGRV